MKQNSHHPSAVLSLCLRPSGFVWTHLNMSQGVCTKQQVKEHKCRQPGGQGQQVNSMFASKLLCKITDEKKKTRPNRSDKESGSLTGMGKRKSSGGWKAEHKVTRDTDWWISVDVGVKGT